MDSSATLSHHQQQQHTKVVPKQCDIFTPGVKYYLSCRSRRTPSLSSSCSSLSSLESFYFHDDPLLMSPASPLIRFSSGVPFSWEHLPGIPKKQNSYNKKKNKDSSTKLLPLPPPTTTTTTTTHSSKKKKESSSSSSIISQSSFQRDPFFAAMVECSKDHDNDNNNHEEITSGSLWSGANKISRSSITDRFGFISLYGSCKNTCAVSESLVYLPRSRRSNEYQHVSGKFL
ncbi:hypothetical protein RIF29_23475 [Crotalaria pallida]|uniref:Uncharacterized protein n=1 Tax=Crotalaria pallida TaxID=3830 RepID=A0AAN9I8M1_CROPI